MARAARVWRTPCASGRHLGWGFALLPLLLLELVVFGFGVSLLATTATVYIRDTPRALSYAARLWMYLTPVVYSARAVPPRIEAYLAWNPLFPLFAAYHEILLGGMPTPGQLLAAGAWALLAAGVGMWVFLRRERDFAVHL